MTPYDVNNIKLVDIDNKCVWLISNWNIIFVSLGARMMFWNCIRICFSIKRTKWTSKTIRKHFKSMVRDSGRCYRMLWSTVRVSMVLISPSSCGDTNIIKTTIVPIPYVIHTPLGLVGYNAYDVSRPTFPHYWPCMRKPQISWWSQNIKPVSALMSLWEGNPVVSGGLHPRRTSIVALW